MAKTKRGLSEAERAERRARDRGRLQHAARELLTSDGWQRWVRARALFHSYSLRNCLLLAAQCHERGIDARRGAGFRTWLKLGRCVRKGEKGLVVLAPMPIKRRKDSEERDEARVVFRSAFVFADSQTDPLPGVDPAPIEPPCEPLSGDSHRHLLERLQAFAGEIDFEVALEPISGGAGGWCDPKRRRIVVDAGLPANAQVRVLVHELAHALVRADRQDDDPDLDAAAEELVAETTAYSVCASSGIDPGEYSIAYLAGWSERTPIATIERTAALIDRLSRRIEDAVAPVSLSTFDDHAAASEAELEGLRAAA
jgi:hypothetical protein